MAICHYQLTIIQEEERIILKCEVNAISDTPGELIKSR